MEPQIETDDAISGAEVKRIITGVNSAISTTFQNANHHEMIRSGTGFEIVDKPQHTRVELSMKMRSFFSEKFKGIDSKYLSEGGDTSVLMYPNTDINGNHELNICSNSAKDNALRRYTIYFVINFGKNENEMGSFIEQTKKNPLFIKSAMERIISPDGDPKNSLLAGRMVYHEKEDKRVYRNLSPFIRLSSRTPVFVETSKAK